MTEILQPLAPTQSPPSPRSQTPTENTLDSLPQSLAQPQRQQQQQQQQTLERVPSYAQKRMSPSNHSRTSQTSLPRSTSGGGGGGEYPAFSSSLSYALVRDFAYPVFHPLHYGATLEPSGASTPNSEWNPARRQSAPDQQWFHSSHSAAAHVGGWSAGPWGGDGVMYGDPEEHEDDDLRGGGMVSLPSTSFSSTAESGVPPLEFAEDEVSFKKGRHRKSKSYGSIPDFERGRRRESGRRSRGDGNDTGIFWFHGQQAQQNAGGGGGRDSVANGGRKDSRNSANLPNRSFHNSTASSHEGDSDPIPLDSEPRTSHTPSPLRSSLGPEDEELFAGPSLALYSFEPENSNELRLEEGQEIMVSYRHGQGWLVASDPETGEQGLVPEAYVRLIADISNYDPETGEWIDVEGEGFEEEEEETEGSSHQETGNWSERDGHDREDGAVKDVKDARKELAGKVESESDVESPGRRGALSSTLFPV